MTPNHNDELEKQIASMFPDMGIRKIERLPAGGNNRLYLLETGKEKFVVKHYFTHPEDKRNRLQAEFSFALFAHQNGIECIPQPIARDDINNLAVFTFLDGRKPNPADVTESAMIQALAFLVELNRYRDSAGSDIPDASESCFSINGHLEMIEKRIHRCSLIVDPSARLFVEEQLVPTWDRVKREMLLEMSSIGLRAEEVLPTCERILSPSDFGFHNSILGEDGRFRFLDFEYAGWDDPAKTVGDFFSHLALPVSGEYLRNFAEGVSGLSSQSDKTLIRIHFLLRLYRLKWCCIALNHFVSTDSERRQFAGHDVEQAKKEQLAKATGLLDSMEQLRGVTYGLH